MSGTRCIEIKILCCEQTDNEVGNIVCNYQDGPLMNLPTVCMSSVNGKGVAHRIDISIGELCAKHWKCDAWWLNRTREELATTSIDVNISSGSVQDNSMMKVTLGIAA